MRYQFYSLAATEGQYCLHSHVNGWEYIALGDMPTGKANDKQFFLAVRSIFDQSVEQQVRADTVAARLLHALVGVCASVTPLRLCVIVIAHSEESVSVINLGFGAVYFLGDHNHPIRLRVAPHDPQAAPESAAEMGSRTATYSYSGRDRLFVGLADMDVETVAKVVTEPDRLEGTSPYILVSANSTSSPQALFGAVQRVGGTPHYWHLDCQMDAMELGRFDPVPAVYRLATEMNGQGVTMALFQFVLGELYRNAVEHGVLGLSSRMIDEHADGMRLYFDERIRRINSLEKGWVRIEVANEPESDGGRLNLELGDSGGGFDQTRVNRERADADSFHGRGIALLEHICDSLQYAADGNQVTATMRWRRA